MLGSGDMTSTIQKEQVAYLGPPSSYSNQVEHVAVVIRLYFIDQFKAAFNSFDSNNFFLIPQPSFQGEPRLLPFSVLT